MLLKYEYGQSDFNSPMKNRNFITTQTVRAVWDYSRVCNGRRIFKDAPTVIPTRQTGQKEIFEWNDDAEGYITHIHKPFAEKRSAFGELPTIPIQHELQKNF